MTKLTLFFNSEKQKVTINKGTNIFYATIEAKIPLRTECGGKGICGKCKIIIHTGNVSKPTNIERKHLSKKELSSGYRLACQTVPKEDTKVIIPVESRIGKRQIITNGTSIQIRLNPLVKKYHLKLENPSLINTKADFERLLSALNKKTKIDKIKIDYNLLRNLPEILRNSNWDVTVTLWDKEKIIAIEPGDTSNFVFGFAVDVGTSKIVGHLVNLLNGKTLATSQIENPQLIHGADIITRIAFANKNETNLKKLQHSVQKSINNIINQACLKANINFVNIYETILVGNTAMQHIYLGISPKFLAFSPYTPTIRASVNLSNREFKLNMNPSGMISGLPLIAGFVGSDAVADILATNISQRDKITVLLDIGTNTEIFLGNSKDILCCSCASGPAFEGARIKNGMKAEVGAIESISITSDFEVKFNTIGHTKPIGLCGSAMIDVVAEMFKQQLIDYKGKFVIQNRTSRFIKTDNQVEFVIAYSNETATKKEIVITQKDIREIQLAKAAIFAGYSVLMKTKNLNKRDIDKILIAGTFGYYINPNNAKILGLIPDLSKKKIELVGNTAIAGA
ncbi:MAG: ASKHA domain-containing protein, partial [Candidatus Heimdallarchaeota archaeon]